MLTDAAKTILIHDTEWTNDDISVCYLFENYTDDYFPLQNHVRTHYSFE